MVAPNKVGGEIVLSCVRSALVSIHRRFGDAVGFGHAISH